MVDIDDEVTLLKYSKIYAAAFDRHWKAHLF